MNDLNKIRNFHNDEENFEKMQIKGNLIDVSVYANIEKKYAMFLKTQIEHFPYMLKSQWRYMFGKSRGSGHNAIKNLVDMKVLGEQKFKGCHYVYPLTRAVKWYKNEGNAKPMDSKANRQSDLPLLDNFMRAEYFLHTGQLIKLNPSSFFKNQFWCRTDKDYLAKKILQKDIKAKIKEKKQELDKIRTKINQISNGCNNKIVEESVIRSLIDVSQQYGEMLVEIEEVLEVDRVKIDTEVAVYENTFLPYVLPKVQAGAIASLSNRWRNKRVIKNALFKFNGTTHEIEFRNSLEPFRFIEACLNIFYERSCYFKSIHFSSTGIKYDLVVIHYPDTNDNRYNQIIDDMNLICACTENSHFTLQVLTENEEQKTSAASTFKRILTNRKNRSNVIDHISANEIRIYNTKIERYFFEGDSDLLFENEDFSQLEMVVAEMKDFLKTNY